MPPQAIDIDKGATGESTTIEKETRRAWTRCIIPKCLLREATVAGPHYDRWLFPPAALLVHFCIGQAYAYSVFNKPLTHLCAAAGGDAGCEEWTLVEVGFAFEIMFIFLGSSTALFGRHLEPLGPRFAGVLAAVLWGGGYLIAGLGVRLHSLALLYLGNSVIGGIGLGFGYISPISTLAQWFPDRRGLAMGLAVAGFGGGAVIGAPLAAQLMTHYPVWKTFVVLGVLDCGVMLAGALAYRVPPEGWRPEGWCPTKAVGNFARSGGHVDANLAVATPQFWLLWVMLCVNVSCGLGVISQASPMVQEIFHGRIDALEAAGVVGLFSLANIAGRLGWAAISDRIGRWWVFSAFFVLGITLYAVLPSTTSFAAFFACCCVMISLYGGGFAASPAYIGDMFGVQQSGAIYGRLLTAWSVGAFLGPYMFTSLRDSEVARGKPASSAYDRTLHILSGLLVLGLVANCLMPIADRTCPIQKKRATTTEEEEEEVKEGEEGGGEMLEIELVVEAEAGAAAAKEGHVASKVGVKADKGGGRVVMVAAAWAVPLAAFGWGLSQVLQRGIGAFQH